MSSQLHETAQATPTPAGLCTFTFQPVPSGQVWTGSVSVPGASPNSVNPILWQAFDSGFPIGQWYGSQSSSTLQVFGTLTVVGTGVAASTTSLIAYMGGVSTPTSQASPWWPSPTPTPPPAQPFQLLNSLFSPIAIPANNGFNLVGGASGVPVPVTLGTSLEISFLNTTANCLMIISWPQSLTASGGPSLSFNIGIGSPSAQSGQIEGWVIPNLGPLLLVTILTGSQPVSVEALIQTGLPPISQYPVISNRVLLNLNNVSIPVGGNSFVLPPYYGPASITFAPNNVAGVGYSISCADYQNVNQALIQPTQGWASGTGTHATDSTIFIPPLINTLEISNATGTAQTVSLSVTVP